MKKKKETRKSTLNPKAGDIVQAVSQGDGEQAVLDATLTPNP